MMVTWFGHCFHCSAIVLFRPEKLQTKLEPSQVVFDGDYKILYKLKDWVSNNMYVADLACKIVSSKIRLLSTDIVWTWG